MSDKPKSKSKDKKSSKPAIKSKKTNKSIIKKSTTIKEDPNISTLDENINISDPNNNITTPLINTTNNSPQNYYDNLPKHQSLNTNPNSQSKDKCDGCYEGEGVCYCATCGKIYCKICEDQIHIVPSNRNHERHSLNEVPHLRKLCYHHNYPLKFFCETCEEPICQECQMIGPHNNKLHKISSIFNSFKKKYSYITQLTKSHLMNKYDMTLNQLSYLDYVTDQVKQVKNSIERDIRSEYCEMLEELNSVEGKKLAVINYESSILQKDLTKMQDIINYINDLNNNESPDMISFLLRYKQLNDSIEFAIAKPIKQKIEININDFPRKQQENKKKLENYAKLEKLLKLKDDIIWKIVNDKQEQRKQMQLFEGNMKSSLDKEKEMKALTEIEEWAKLSDKYAMELQKYNLICCFCGCYLDEKTVNTECNMNNNENINIENLYSNSPINEDVKGSGRHYFVPPQNNKDIHDDNIKKIETNPFDRNAYYDTNYKSMSLNEQTRDEGWLFHFINELNKNKEQFLNVLKEHDSDNDFHINIIEFNEAVKKMGYDLNEEQLNYVLTTLALNKEKIGINEIIDNIDKVNSVES